MKHTGLSPYQKLYIWLRRRVELPHSQLVSYISNFNISELQIFGKKKEWWVEPLMEDSWASHPVTTNKFHYPLPPPEKF